MDIEVVYYDDYVGDYGVVKSLYVVYERHMKCWRDAKGGK